MAAFNKRQQLAVNLEAIKKVFELEREQRAATSEEKELLIGYAGFGGIKCILSPCSVPNDIDRWSESEKPLFPLVRELYSIIRENSPDERSYHNTVFHLKSSVLTSFYTPPPVVDALATALANAGVKPLRFLDPSAGTGQFLRSFAPLSQRQFAFEKEPLTGKILRLIHDTPDTYTHIRGFEEIDSVMKGAFDLISSNIPFGNFSVFDPLFSVQRKEPLYQKSCSAIHHYFFVKAVEKVRDGGIVAFITSQGVMNSSSSDFIRQHMMENCRLVSAVRLPNNLFKEYAGTEVGSDLIVLQKNQYKVKYKLSEEEKQFLKLTGQGNQYFANDRNIIHTSQKEGTDPYGKPAMIYHHDGGVAGIAGELATILANDLKQNLRLDHFYEADKTYKTAVGAIQREQAVRLRSRPVSLNPDPDPVMGPPPSMSQTPVTLSQQPIGQTPETLPIPSVSSPSPSVSSPQRLNNLYNNIRRQTKKRGDSMKGQLSLLDHPDFWEEHPPLPQTALAPASPAAARTKTTPKETNPQQETNPETNPKKVEMPEGTSLPPSPTEPLPDLTPRLYEGPVEEHYKEGTLVAVDGWIGALAKDDNGDRMFHPLDLPLHGAEKLQLYILLRDTYHRLYTYEATQGQANDTLRFELNRLYDEFQTRFGDLCELNNHSLILMDEGGQEILFLERRIDGQTVKADIFRESVSIKKEVEAQTAQEALAASLNQFGAVNMEYLCTLLPNQSQEEILHELRQKIYYNPLVGTYEVAETFIAGNVIEKIALIEAYRREHPDDPAAERSLEILRSAIPTPVPFHDIGFNLGERWIHSSVYEEFAKELFQADKVTVLYNKTADEYFVDGQSTYIVSHKYAVSSYSRDYNGYGLLKHALMNTTPSLTRTIRDRDGSERKIPDGKAIQQFNTKTEEIREEFNKWLFRQDDDFKNQLAGLYNQKFNCFVKPHYDGSQQTFPDLDLKGLGIRDLYSSQKDAVWMLKLNRGGVIDHEVLRP